MSVQADDSNGDFASRLASAKQCADPSEATKAFVATAFETLYQPWDDGVLGHAELVTATREHNNTQLAHLRDEHGSELAELRQKESSELARYGAKLFRTSVPTVADLPTTPTESELAAAVRRSADVPSMNIGKSSEWDRQLGRNTVLLAIALFIYCLWRGVSVLPQGGFSVGVGVFIALPALALPIVQWWSRHQQARDAFLSLSQIVSALVKKNEADYALKRAALLDEGERKIKELQQKFENVRLTALRQQSALAEAVVGYYDKLSPWTCQPLNDIDFSTWRAATDLPLAIGAGIFAPRAEQQSRLLYAEGKGPGEEHTAPDITVSVTIEPAPFEKFCRRLNGLMNFDVKDEEKRESLAGTVERAFRIISDTCGQPGLRPDGGIRVETAELPSGRAGLQWVLDSMAETPPKAMTFRAALRRADPSRGRHEEDVSLDLLGGAMVECANAEETQALLRNLTTSLKQSNRESDYFRFPIASCKEDFARQIVIEPTVLTPNYDPDEVRFAQEAIDVSQLARVPGMLSLRPWKPLLLTTRGDGATAAHETVSVLIWRLLTSIAPGKVRFTFIDPVGLGQNVAEFLELADFDPMLVTTRAWTDMRQIETQLADLSAHMETVIQKYLRKDHTTIDEYNVTAGATAEPYRVLVIFDFPQQFSETAFHYLRRIIENGSRCGVWPIIVCSADKLDELSVELRRLAPLCLSLLTADDSKVSLWQEPVLDKSLFVLYEAPGASSTQGVLRKIGDLARQGRRVEVPFDQVLEMAAAKAGYSPSDIWSKKSVDGLHVPLGTTGSKVQFMDLGVDLTHHALLLGRPGSGKSNLLHVIITSIARLYSPEEVKLYLIDFKKGVEFKPYADTALPHAAVVAIDSEREFGLSVLRGLNDEFKRRGDACNRENVQNIESYRRKTGAVDPPMPRILLIVDEFQTLFLDDDQISRESALLLHHLVSQGRAFGIHVLLASQTLANVDAFGRGTRDLMTVRIALQCSEADSRLILSEDNTAARSLSRPGEAIYNSDKGLEGNNNPFQVAVFKDEDRTKHLNQVASAAQEKGVLSRPVVFKGHEAASLEECVPLVEKLAEKNWSKTKQVPVVWVGEPIALKPATSMRIVRQGGTNLLALTRIEPEGLGVLVSTIAGIAAQQSPAEARFVAINLLTAETEWADVPQQLKSALPHEFEIVARRGIQATIAKLHTELKARLEEEKSPAQSVYLVMLGLHRARDMRLDESIRSYDAEETQKPSAELFAQLLRDGPDVGIHTLAWCESYSGLERIVERGAIGEFGVKCVGGLDGRESQALLDSDAAVKLSERPHRMIKADDNMIGVLETFRPYATPAAGWLESFGSKLKARG